MTKAEAKKVIDSYTYYTAVRNEARQKGDTEAEKTAQETLTRMEKLCNEARRTLTKK